MGQVLKPTGILRIAAKPNNFHHFFAQNLKLHLLDTLSTLTQRLPMYSLWILVIFFPWKLLLLKREYRISFNPHKKGQGTLQLWYGQSYSSSQKIGHGKGNYSICWSASCRVHPPSSILCPCGDINLSFFFPMQPLIFIFGINAFEITARSVTFGWNQLLDSTVIGRDGQKGESMDKEQGCTYPSKSSLAVFFQLRGFWY